MSITKKQFDYWTDILINLVKLNVSQENLYIIRDEYWLCRVKNKDIPIPEEKKENSDEIDWVELDMKFLDVLLSMRILTKQFLEDKGQERIRFDE